MDVDQYKGKSQPKGGFGLRIGLFIATNVAIIALLTIVFAVLGLDSNTFTGLLVLSAVIGFGGSLISLAMSKWVAKRATGAYVIEQPSNETEQWLVSTVERLAGQSGIGMPEVAIFPSEQPNAFATGARRNDALVAVSVGLLRHMSREEVEAVGFQYADPTQVQGRYKVSELRDGWNKDNDGDFFFISNPALGLWKASSD